MTLTMNEKRKIWQNEYVKTAIMIIVIVAVVFGFWYGSQLILNTEYPALAVASGSMCKVQHMHCDGWSHPFSHTLHVGDLIIVKGVDGADINAAPEPYGDIIVFRQPNGELIVHRAIDGKVEGEKWSFQTKGDGNDIPDSAWTPEDRVIGKVVMRVPWIGHLALFMHNSTGIFIVVILVVILVVLEFVIPAFSRKESEAHTEETL